MRSGFYDWTKRRWGYSHRNNDCRPTTACGGRAPSTSVIRDGSCGPLMPGVRRQQSAALHRGSRGGRKQAQSPSWNLRGRLLPGFGCAGSRVTDAHRARPTNPRISRLPSSGPFLMHEVASVGDNPLLRRARLGTGYRRTEAESNDDGDKRVTRAHTPIPPSQGRSRAGRSLGNRAAAKISLAPGWACDHASTLVLDDSHRRCLVHIESDILGCLLHESRSLL